MAGQNSKRNNRSPEVGPNKPHIAWQRHIQSRVTTFLGTINMESPNIGDRISIDAGETLYVPYGSSSLCAMSPEGKVLWRRVSDDYDVLAPALAENRIIHGFTGVFSRHSALICFDQRGKQQWLFEPSDDGLESDVLVGNDGKLFVTTSGRPGHVYCLDLSGGVLWNYPIGGHVLHGTAQHPEGAIIVSGETDLFALDENGKLLWQTVTSFPPSSDPAVADDGRILLIGETGRMTQPEPTVKVICVSASGRELWSDVLKSMSHQPSIAQDGSAILVLNNGAVSCYGPDGTRTWLTQISTSAWESAAIDAEETIFAVGHQEIVALDREGKERWRLAMPQSLSTGISIGADGTLYCGSWEGDVFAIGEMIDP